jgi:hypothetical protein
MAQFKLTVATWRDDTTATWSVVKQTGYVSANSQAEALEFINTTLIKPLQA